MSCNCIPDRHYHFDLLVTRYLNFIFYGIRSCCYISLGNLFLVSINWHWAITYPIPGSIWFGILTFIFYYFQNIVTNLDPSRNPFIDKQIQKHQQQPSSTPKTHIYIIYNDRCKRTRTQVPTQRFGQT